MPVAVREHLDEPSPGTRRPRPHAHRRRARLVLPRVSGGPSRFVPSADPLPEIDGVHAGALRTVLRLAELLALSCYLVVAGAFDRYTRAPRTLVRRRPRAEVEAVRGDRLRRVLLRLGGTFVKIGQQLSIRTDLLPRAYCVALEPLQDDADAGPIPEPYVRSVLERQGRRPLEALFRAPFDFTPIARASIACVYDARLPGGARVAVKVRRPDIVRSFKADLAALEWVLRSAEFLTLMRPGVSKTFRSELDLMLLEELDFRIETRYQELFRRYFRRRPHLRTTAPRLCYELCGQDVVVSEFIDGLSVKRLVAAVESGDPCALSRLPFPVDPSVVAKHLVRGSHYGFFECPFFHGDPHPGNILLRPGNRIVLVDFGACGVFAQRERDQLALLHYHHSREDVGGMVQCVIGLMEPLPPIDVDEFRRRLEHAWWKGFYGVKSRHAEWKERTSFPLWSALLNLVRDYRIPLPLNVLRMIRATLLYDTVAARIYARIDVFKEYRRYHEGYARRVKREVQAAVVRQILCGLDQANYVRLAQLWNVGNLLLSRTQLFLQQPAPAFASLVSKGFELVTIAIKFVLLGGALTAVAAAGVWLTWRDGHTGLLALLGRRHVPDVLAALLALVALKYVRQAWFRLDDKDPV